MKELDTKYVEEFVVKGFLSNKNERVHVIS